MCGVSSAILWSICGFVMFALIHAGKMKALCYVVLLVGAICSCEAGEIIGILIMTFLSL